MKALIDENLPPALARALNALASTHDGDEIQHITELAPRGTPDDELFRLIASRGYQVHITQDQHNRKPLECRVIAECGLIVFQLSKAWASQPFWSKSTQLIRWWPAIREHAGRMKPPAIFAVGWQLSGKGQFTQIRI